MGSGYFERFLASPEAAGLPVDRDTLVAACRAGFEDCGHGDLDRWRESIAQLDSLAPPVLLGDGPTARRWRLDERAVQVEGTLPPAGERRLEDALRALMPWRKGPFSLAGVAIDSEWQSWMKWERLARAVDFRGCSVLDIGAGNGYYGYRMLGAGASSVIGIDPTPLYIAQFLALQAFGGPLPVTILPLRAEALEGRAAYDRVLSLGVLYHQRAPIAHLQALRRWCAPQGQVVVETLVVPGGPEQVLTPEDRYARMRNVWFLPSAEALLRWLTRAGFREARIADVSPTTTAEQRRTPWMSFHSLAEFLDPEDPTRTVEGYPGPCRAIAVASA